MLASVKRAEINLKIQPVMVTLAMATTVNKAIYTIYVQKKEYLLQKSSFMYITMVLAI